MEETIEEKLQENWIWSSTWDDQGGETNSAGGVVIFTRTVHVSSPQQVKSVINITADTRYKLLINGVRRTVGPTRSCSQIWYYDTIDLAPWLTRGINTIEVQVIRFYPGKSAGTPFSRTRLPGLTICGTLEVDDQSVADLGTLAREWTCKAVAGLVLPTGSKDDYFLNIYEHMSPSKDTSPSTPALQPRAYGFSSSTGEGTPWNLRPRLIPFPIESPCEMKQVIKSVGHISTPQWSDFFLRGMEIELLPNSHHRVEVEASEHSTAFTNWLIQRPDRGHATLEITYAECYEDEPIYYPWTRNKGDRVSPTGRLLGPKDIVTVTSGVEAMNYEPVWFRTFRFMVLEIEVGESAIGLSKFVAKQVNYPIKQKASFLAPGIKNGDSIWKVSLRTLRNCMFDGYSDCPFYEQLQYAEDTRSSGLFHYLLSGDDRLMRQAITGWAASVLPEGLIQARYPSHIPQVIPGFALFWILQVCDHHTFFNDSDMARDLLPLVMRVLKFFDSYVDHRGLLANLPRRYWQFIDWTAEWTASSGNRDPGVPVMGRVSNTHTVASLLLAYVLQQAAKLAEDLDEVRTSQILRSRSSTLINGVNSRCFDGTYYLDSSTDCPATKPSQHAQIFAVLSGAAIDNRAKDIIKDAFTGGAFTKASYVFMHYAFRAFAKVGLYEVLWDEAWEPWHEMLGKNLSTWEEDSVSQRSDCHAWGSIAIYEYLVEVSGIHPTAPGWKSVLFKPRVTMVNKLESQVAMGHDNLATIQWSEQEAGDIHISLRFAQATELVSELPGEVVIHHGLVKRVELVYQPRKDAMQ